MFPAFQPQGQFPPQDVAQLQQLLTLYSTQPTFATYTTPFAHIAPQNPVSGVISSAASFHQPAAKNEIKLFVGGLAFPTTEEHLHNYFSTIGKVVNTIVMRDRAT